jgi:hypothetical protein
MSKSGNWLVIVAIALAGCGGQVEDDATSSAAVSAAQTLPCGVMWAGNTLYQGDSIWSCDDDKLVGKYQLTLQTDGNLVLYDHKMGTGPVWATGVRGDYAVMQSDGNFVLYQWSGHAVWASGTWRYPGSYLALQDDGNLVVYDGYAHAHWATGSWRTRKVDQCHGDIGTGWLGACGQAADNQCATYVHDQWTGLIQGEQCFNYGSGNNGFIPFWQTTCVNGASYCHGCFSRDNIGTDCGIPGHDPSDTQGAGGNEFGWHLL